MRRIRSAIVICVTCAALAAFGAQAQQAKPAPSAPAAPVDDGRYVPGSDLDGTWEGVISNGGLGLNLIFVFKTREPNVTVATVDVSEQDAKDIPVTLSRNGNRVKLDMKEIGGVYEATVSPDLRTMAGRWVQAGAADQPVPLILKRKES